MPSKSSVLVANPAELAETQDSGQLPVGSGIEFRPRLNRKTVAGAAGTASTGPLDLNDGKGSEEEVCRIGDTVNVQQKSQRKFRSRTVS